MKTEELLRRFLRRCRLRNLAASTIDVYHRSLVVWLREMPLDVEEISLAVLEQFFDDWDVAVKTKFNAISIIKEMFTYAVEIDVLSANPAQALPMPRLPKPEPEYLTDEQLAQLLAVARTAGKEWYTTRHYALVLFLLDTGCRVSEATWLPRQCIQADRAEVMGKGSKPRTVFFCAETLAALQAHWAMQTGGVYCFENRDGARMKTNKVQRLFQRSSDKLGFRVHAHLLRHTCATLMLENGGNLRMVQEQLGHANVQTTERYAHIRDCYRELHHAEVSALKKMF